MLVVYNHFAELCFPNSDRRLELIDWAGLRFLKASDASLVRFLGVGEVADKMGLDSLECKDAQCRQP